MGGAGGSGAIYSKVIKIKALKVYILLMNWGGEIRINKGERGD